MSTFITFISLVFAVILAILCVEFDAVRRLICKLFFGTLAVAIMIYGGFALRNAVANLLY